MVLPVTATTLWRDCPPCLSSTWRSGTPNNSAMSFNKASLARPSTGGAASRSLSASPCKPAIPLRFAPGWTCRVRVMTSPLRRCHSAIYKIPTAMRSSAPIGTITMSWQMMNSSNGDKSTLPNMGTMRRKGWRKR